MDFSTWLAFFAAAWAISISPGAGAVAAMSNGLNHGFRRGYVGTLGLVLGVWTQLVVVGIGVGALVAASATAFLVVKWAGVAYLVWLGVQQWRAPAQPLAADRSDAPYAARTLVLKGWMVNAVNPKGTVFLVAVLPQFLDTMAPLWPQYLVMACTLAFTDLVVMAGYTGLAARLQGSLKSPRQLKAMNRVFGGLFVAAGMVLSVFKRGV